MKAVVKVVFSATVSILAFLAVGQSAYGVATDTQATNGKVNFLENTTGDIIQPGTELPIIPEGGAKGTGSLRFEWVPDFNFGDLSIISTGQTAPVQFMKYKPKTASAIENPSYNTPHFVQITDERGLDTGKWVVKVSATKFATAVGDPIQHTLSATTIQLAGKTVTNNTKSAAEIAADFTAPTVTGATGVSISTASATPTVLLQTATGKVSNTSKTSFVFSNNYVASDYSITETQAETTYGGVLINIPSSDTPKKASYTSTVTWTLEDTY